MTTRVYPRQVKGENYATLKAELEDLQRRIGFFLGEVDFEAGLALLTPKIGEQVFIRNQLKWVRWTGAEWQNVTTTPPAGSAGTGSGAGDGIIQITKLGVAGATTLVPVTVDVNVPYTLDFKRPAVEVLKFIPGATDKVDTLVEFNNTDITDFVEDDKLLFDGKMQLKNSYVKDLTLVGPLESGQLYSFSFDSTKFLKTESIKIK